MSEKILIVDDSRNWLDYHQANLTEFYGAQFALERANCAREAYDMVYNNLDAPYKLIISDLQMELDFEPKLAGEWFVEQVKKLDQYKNTSIILISATYNIKTIAERLGVDYMPKSIAARNLLEYRIKMDEIINN